MFKLNIESSKDIDELHIVFSDGTSNIVCNKNNNDINNSSNSNTGNNVKKQTKKPVQKTEKLIKSNKVDKSLNVQDFDFDDYLDTEIDKTSMEVIEKPNINLGSRPVKVDDNLQNFDL